MRAFGLAAALAALASPVLASPGGDLFNDNCAACHQQSGKGVPGAFPALAGDKFVLGPPAPVIATVLNGRGGMPAFKAEFSDVQLSQILTYVRTSWGNKAGPVAPGMVAAARAQSSAAVKKGLQAH